MKSLSGFRGPWFSSSSAPSSGFPLTIWGIDICQVITYQRLQLKFETAQSHKRCYNFNITFNGIIASIQNLYWKKLPPPFTILRLKFCPIIENNSRFKCSFDKSLFVFVALKRSTLKPPLFSLLLSFRYSFKRYFFKLPCVIFMCNFQT